MKPARIVLILVSALCAVDVPPAHNRVWADDYNPPGWRGQEYTTYQQWVFGTSSLTPAPDDISAEHPGVAMTVVDNGPTTVWNATDPIETTREGVWRSEDWFQITIQNFPEPNPLKEIWIQLTYKAEEYPDIYAELPGGGGPHWATLIDEETIVGSEYLNQTWKILIEPNPDSEIIYIMPGTCVGWVDQVVIDTICTFQEPLCVVRFDHFARFAEHWLDAGCDAGNDWCGGADLDQLGEVDWLDLELLLDNWLDYCPYLWSLE